MDMNRLKTTSEIADDLNVPRHVVVYATQRYRIVESQRAGIIRLFDRDAAASIKRAVQRTTGRAISHVGS